MRISGLKLETATIARRRGSRTVAIASLQLHCASDAATASGAGTACEVQRTTVSATASGYRHAPAC
jgi:hypothetical protein